MKLSILSLNKPGITDFAKARNELLKKAKTDWVFFVDTDEKISGNLHKEILTAIRSKFYSGYYIYRRNYFLGKYIGTDKILRLGKKKGGKWIRRVHEIWKITGHTGELKNPLIHNTAGNLHEFISKTNFYSTIHAEENLESGKRSSLFKIVVYPVAKFFQSILIGRGLVFSMLQSFHSFLSWSKQSLASQGPGKKWQLQKG